MGHAGPGLGLPAPQDDRAPAAPRFSWQSPPPRAASTRDSEGRRHRSQRGASGPRATRSPASARHVCSTQKMYTYLKVYANPFEKILLLWLNPVILINVCNSDPFLDPRGLEGSRLTAVKMEHARSLLKNDFFRCIRTSAQNRRMHMKL